MPFEVAAMMRKLCAVFVGLSHLVVGGHCAGAALAAFK
jgi:hypothetical protein